MFALLSFLNTVFRNWKTKNQTAQEQKAKTASSQSGAALLSRPCEFFPFQLLPLSQNWILMGRLPGIPTLTSSWNKMLLAGFAPPKQTSQYQTPKHAITQGNTAWAQNAAQKQFPCPFSVERYLNLPQKRHCQPLKQHLWTKIWHTWAQTDGLLKHNQLHPPPTAVTGSISGLSGLCFLLVFSLGTYFEHQVASFSVQRICWLSESEMHGFPHQLKFTGKVHWARSHAPILEAKLAVLLSALWKVRTTEK